MQAVARLPLMPFMSFLLSPRDEGCLTVESRVLEDVSRGGKRHVNLVGRAVELRVCTYSFRRGIRIIALRFLCRPAIVSLNHCYSKARRPTELQGTVIPSAIDACLASQSPRLLEGSLSISQNIVLNPRRFHLHLHTITLF
jgi:hypothetical protein